MAIALRTLDDGAWISVNDSREVGVSDVWILECEDCCSCPLSYILLEGFTDVRVDGTHVVAGTVGRCLECGQRVSIDRLPVGRVIDGEFERYDPASVSRVRGAVESL